MSISGKLFSKSVICVLIFSYPVYNVFQGKCFSVFSLLVKRVDGVYVLKIWQLFFFYHYKAYQAFTVCESLISFIMIKKQLSNFQNISIHVDRHVTCTRPYTKCARKRHYAYTKICTQYWFHSVKIIWICRSLAKTIMLYENKNSHYHSVFNFQHSSLKSLQP